MSRNVICRSLPYDEQMRSKLNDSTNLSFLDEFPSNIQGTLNRHHCR